MMAAAYAATYPIVGVSPSNQQWLLIVVLAEGLAMRLLAYPILSGAGASTWHKSAQLSFSLVQCVS